MFFKLLFIGLYMKIGLIGLGHWGKNHAKVLSNFKDEGIISELYFFDIDKQLLKKMSDTYNGIAIDTLKKMQSLGLDAIDIVVPADLHYKIALPFIENNIKTFIEKPFTDNIEDAKKLINLADDASRDIMIGHIFRFHRGILEAKKLISQGKIGKLKKIDIRRLAFSKPRLDNGVILSLAIHDLDLFYYFSDNKKPQSLQVLKSTIYGPTEDHVFIKSVLNNNVIGLIEESWMYPSNQKVRTASFQGTKGEIFLNFNNYNELLLNHKYLDENKIVNDNGIQKLTFKDSRAPLTEELYHFITRSKNNLPFESDAYIGLNAIEMCSQIL